MTAGRKPKHAFYALELGEMAILKGKAALYPHQFIRQYNNKPNRTERLEVVRKGKKVYAKRIL